MSEIFEKPKKKRKPLTEEQKKVLVDRLKKAREAKKAKKNNVEIKVTEEPSDEGTEPIVKAEPIVEDVAPPMPISSAPTKKAKRLTKAEKSAREKSLELQSMRDELELQQLRNQIDELKRPKKPLPKIEEEKSPQPKSNKNPPVEKPKITPSVIEPPTIPPKQHKPTPIKHRYAPTSVWSMF